MTYYCWASDLSQTSGEGRLSLMFLSHVNKYSKKNIICHFNSGKGIFSKNKLKHLSYNKNTKNNFYNNYVKIFYGVFLMWFYFFKKKKNYLYWIFAFMEFFNIFIITAKGNSGTNNR